ncbi:NAD(P)/FAD-dependent oxidoreductase [Chloroflexota bacterium]
MQRILVIGAGTGGVMAANRMRRAFGRDEVDITVLERSDRHIYQPGFVPLLFDLDKPENLIRPTQDLLLNGINLIADEATLINPKENKVTTANSGDLLYDYLVIATGAQLYLDEPEGMKEGLERAENVFTFYSLEDAIKLRDALKRLEGGTIVSSVAEMPIKCLAAPVKFMMLAESTMRMRGQRDKYRFVLTVPTLSVPPNIEPYASALEAILKARDIEVMLDFTPATVDPENGTIEDFKGSRVKFDLLAIIPPHEGQDLLQNSQDVADPVGWVPCDKNSLRHRSVNNIYVIGDAGNFPSGKTASGARKQAKVLAERMRDHIRGREPEAIYDGHTICPIYTRHGRAMFAEFDYDKSISPAKESYIKWLIHIHMLRHLYWNFMLKGLI